MRKTFKIFIALILGLLCFSALFQNATAVDNPQLISSNATCGKFDSRYFEIKVDPAVSGSYTDGYVHVDVTVTGDSVSFVSDVGLDAVFVKGGPGGNLYTYDEETEAGNLHAPLNLKNKNNKYYGLSHINFCYDAEVQIGKTANTSYTRTFDWNIDKTVSESALNVLTGQSSDVAYLVSVTKTGFHDSDWNVEGTITISNPTLMAATLTSVSDILSDPLNVDVICDVEFPFVLGRNQSLTCTYTSPLNSGDDRVNTANVNTSGKVGGNTISVPVVFGEPSALIHNTVAVEDTMTGPLGVVAGDTNFSYLHTFVCDADAGNHENTATIVQTGQSASASVVVTCITPPAPSPIPNLLAQWCSPGYWKNHTTNWPIPPETSYNGVFDPDLSGNPSLLTVISSPSTYGGPTTNSVADYLSDNDTRINFTGERIDNCPL
ncbi:MAG TPA: hypothetical protein VJ246_04125 [Patescibacteria group bacterium]|nr:hypothetical protein [Patescibacteria group bacterium]